MQDAQTGIAAFLGLVLVGGVSLIGMVFLHSTGSKIRFRAAPVTEPPLWSGWLVVLALVGYHFFLLFFLLFFEGIRESGGVILFDLPGEYVIPAPGDPYYVLYPSKISYHVSSLTGGMLLGGGLVASWIWLVVVFKLRQPLATLGFCRASVVNLFPVVLFSLFIIAPTLLCGILWTHLLQLLGREPVPQDLVLDFSRALWWGDTLEVSLMVLNAVVLAPLWEELIFRGFFFGLLRSRWGTLAALVFSSLVFSVYHLNLTAFLPLFFVGIALGYVYSRTRSIYFSILAHALFNGMNLLIQVVFSVS